MVTACTRTPPEKPARSTLKLIVFNESASPSQQAAPVHWQVSAARCYKVMGATGTSKVLLANGRPAPVWWLRHWCGGSGGPKQGGGRRAAAQELLLSGSGGGAAPLLESSHGAAAAVPSCSATTLPPSLPTPPPPMKPSILPLVVHCTIDSLRSPV